MANNLELPSHSSENASLGDEMQGLFKELLHNTAERIELACPTDETIFKTEQAVFGKFSEDTISIARTNSKSKIMGRRHSGSIRFICADDSEKNLLLTNALRHAQTWADPEDNAYSGRGVLTMLEERWPVTDDLSRELFNQLKGSHEDTIEESQLPRIPADSVFDFIENYTLRRETGEHSYQMKWFYTKPNAEVVNGKTCEQTIRFTISSDQKDSLRKISVELRMARPNISQRVSYYICTDGLGSTTLRADALNPLTMLRNDVPVEPEEITDILAVAEQLIETLIAEKTPKD